VPWLVAAAVTAPLASCAGINGQVRTQSFSTGAVLASSLPVLAYSATDRNTADIYLTDLTEEQLDPGTDLSSVTGNLVHIHLFVTPSAGDTPIRSTACSATIRHFVLARGQIGVYGGGGFLNPSRRPGRSTLGGSIRGATLRLVSSTPGFQDLVGPADFSASFNAPLDKALSAEIADRAVDLLEAIEKSNAPR
jgi:hypothetical protein